MMKNWKVVKSETSKLYYICLSVDNRVRFTLIKDKLTRKEACSFWKILTKLRS